MIGVEYRIGRFNISQYGNIDTLLISAGLTLYIESCDVIEVSESRYTTVVDDAGYRTGRFDISINRTIDTLFISVGYTEYIESFDLSQYRNLDTITDQCWI